MLKPSAISVRQMHEGDEHALKTLARRAFPPLGSAVFPSSPNGLVAERDRELVGAVVLSTFGLPGGRKCGVMFWLMSDPKARGLGVGRRLVADALRYFEERGCEEVFASIEGYNTSSANIFATRGFSVLSFGEQLRRYGILGTFLLWLRASHLGDVGHFLWVCPGHGRPDNPVLQWWVGTLMNILIFLLAGWRGGWLEGLSLTTVLGVALIVLVLFGLREGAMRLLAHLGGLSVRHRAWESAFPLSLGVAVAFGVFFPTPGSVYPRHGAWRYRDLLPRLGSTALAGASVILLFAWGALTLESFGRLSPEVTLWVGIARIAGLMLAIVDVLLVFFPFAAFDGRRIWDWNRAVWGVLAVAVLGLLLVGGYPFIVAVQQR